MTRLALVFLLVPALAAAEAPISRVVVYTDRAQVTRSLPVACAAGAAQFGGLPATLDPKTLAAALDGPGSIEGLTHVVEPAAARGQAEVLEQQLRKLDQQIATARGDVEAQRALEGKLRAYREHLARTWSEQAIGANPPLGTWDAALDLLRQQALTAGRKVREAEARQRDLLVARGAASADLARVQEAGRKTTVRATVFVRCTGTRTVRLSYVVPNATWRVAYEAHAERARKQVTLVAQAIVQQGTGEDWANVRVAVSTANLQREHVPPKIERLTVIARKPVTTTKVLTRRFERREHLKAEANQDGDGVPDQADRRGPAAAPDLGPALEIEARDAATVPADGREVMVTLEQRAVAAPLELETVPKLFPFVYERAAISNPFTFIMLPGPVGLFVDRAYVGTTHVKRRAPREPFALSFGVVNEVQVERYVKAETMEGPGVLGAKKRLRHRYQIDVGNWTGTARTIRVRENLPVAQHQEIDVGLEADATPPTAWDKTDGILTWDLPIPARTKRTVTLSYTITLPSSYVVTGY
jgi:uncharacterized protein (TIGR02231 family)